MHGYIEYYFATELVFMIIFTVRRERHVHTNYYNFCKTDYNKK